MTREFIYRASRPATNFDQLLGRDPTVEIQPGQIHAPDITTAIKSLVDDEVRKGSFFYSVAVRDPGQNPTYTNGVYLSGNARLDRVFDPTRVQFADENQGLVVDFWPSARDVLGRDFANTDLSAIIELFNHGELVARSEQTGNEWKPLEILAGRE